MFIVPYELSLCFNTKCMNEDWSKFFEFMDYAGIDPCVKVPGQHYALQSSQLCCVCDGCHQAVAAA